VSAASVQRQFALAHHREDGRELVERLHREELARLMAERRGEQPGQPARDEDLPDVAPGCPVAEEWGLFRREVARLIREGARGHFALLKVGKPVTVWDTRHDAVQAAELLSGQERCLVQESQPYLRPLHGRPT
jgi:hypothetical protein